MSQQPTAKNQHRYKRPTAAYKDSKHKVKSCCCFFIFPYCLRMLEGNKYIVNYRSVFGSRTWTVSATVRDLNVVAYTNSKKMVNVSPWKTIIHFHYSKNEIFSQAIFNILKKPKILQKQTIPQKKALEPQL